MLRTAWSRKTIIVPLLVAMAMLSSAGIARADVDVPMSVEVDGTGVGQVTVELVVAPNPPDNLLKIVVDTTAAQSKADIAAAIAAAANAKIPGVAQVNGDRVNFVTFKTPEGGEAGLYGVHMGVTVATMPPAPAPVVGLDDYYDATGVRAAVSFDPDLITNGTVLTADAVISAGFSSGLSPVSFMEPAGASIFTLASALNDALRTGGYDSSLIDSHDVQVGSAGAVLPTDFMFLVAPVIGSDSLGISIDVHAVPEPGSIGLLVAAILGLCVMRTSHGRRTGHRAGSYF